MKQTIETKLGVTIILIFAMTVGAFVWKWEKGQPEVEQVQTRNIVFKSKTDDSKQQQENKTNQNEKEKQVGDCSEKLIQERVCLNGEVIARINSNCKQSSCSKDEKSYYSPFIKKEQHIYYEYYKDLTLIKDADIDTFEFIGLCASVEMSGSYYGKDGKYIYVNNEKKESINATSFRYLGSFSNGYQMPYSVSISEDNNSIYFGCGKSVRSVDKNTFEILENSYEKDKNKVYYLDQVLPKSDPATFEVIKYQKTDKLFGNFGLDKNHVYLEGIILKGIDPKTCNDNGLERCLPENWQDLIDYSTESERGKKL